MSLKRNRKKHKLTRVKEPKTSYGSNNLSVHFFSSFEEENEFTAKQRALLSYDERMSNAEKLRRKIFSKHLLPNGKWKPIAKVFKVMPPYTNDTW